MTQDHATPKSIARAKLETQLERDHIERVTGLRIADDGTVTPRAIVIQHCHIPGCPFCAARETAQWANSVIEMHVRRRHES